MQIKISKFVNIIFLVLLAHPTSLAQQGFSYKRVLPKAPGDGWHEVVLPASIFSHVAPDYRDLRLMKIQGADSIEIPYLLAVHEDDVTTEELTLRMLNKSKKSDQLYVTFELDRGQSVTSLQFFITEDNFDAKVTLEGSQDQQTWFEIVSQQRILSIKNNQIDFRSTTISFPETNYRFLRAEIKSPSALTLQRATFQRTSTKHGRFQKIAPLWKGETDKKNKQTVVDIRLKDAQPIRSLEVSTHASQDYYRYFTLETLTDSAKTPKGWTYYYQPVTQGYLTSVFPNHFSFIPITTSRLRLRIFNEDNQPLRIDSIKLTAPMIGIRAKLQHEDEYTLLYGNAAAEKPSYDIVYFKDQVPDSIPLISPGAEINLNGVLTKTSPLIESKWWLYTAMFAIIGILGFFTIRMMKAKS
jgi:hypothetical protein